MRINSMKMKKLIGYSCKVCRGVRISETSNAVIHSLCDGVLEPVYEVTTLPKDSVEDWERRFEETFKVRGKGWILDKKLRKFIGCELASSLQAERERVRGMIEGMKRNQENKKGTECGACGASFPTICECQGYNAALTDLLSNLEKGV